MESQDIVLRFVNDIELVMGLEKKYEQEVINCNKFPSENQA